MHKDLWICIFFVTSTLIYCVPKFITNEVVLDTSKKQFIIKNLFTKDRYIPSYDFIKVTINMPMLSYFKISFKHGKEYYFIPSLKGVNFFTGRDLDDLLEKIKHDIGRPS